MAKPSIRRAHWHSFWTGSKSEPEKRKLVLKWLPATFVNADDYDDLIPIIHDVKSGADGNDSNPPTEDS